MCSFDLTVKDYFLIDFFNTKHKYCCKSTVNLYELRSVYAFPTGEHNHWVPLDVRSLYQCLAALCHNILPDMKLPEHSQLRHVYCGFMRMAFHSKRRRLVSLCALTFKNGQVAHLNNVSPNGQRQWVVAVSPPLYLDTRWSRLNCFFSQVRQRII